MDGLDGSRSGGLIEPAYYYAPETMLLQLPTIVVASDEKSDVQGASFSDEFIRQDATDEDGAIAGSALWSHNGSVLRLRAVGEKRTLKYEVPREGIQDEGVEAGTVLFEGRRNGQTYSGTAYVFSKRCGSSGYQVNGLVSDNERRIELSGQAPRLNQSCKIVGRRDDTLLFQLMD